MANFTIASCTILGVDPRDGYVAELIITGESGTALEWDLGSGTYESDIGEAYGTGETALNAAANANMTFTITSLGFDATGAATTVERTAYATRVLRNQYAVATPNHTTDDIADSGADLRVRVALSQPIYAKDDTGVGNSGTAPTVTIAAGTFKDQATADVNNAVTDMSVTNNSTLAYPKAIQRADRVAGVWAADRVDADFVHACRAYHKFGVACVKFDATGVTSANTESATVTTPTTTLRASGNYVQNYQTTHAVASYTSGESIDLRVRVYPAVGDSTSVFDTNDYTTEDNECLGMNKHTIVYNTAVNYAVVDTAGNDTTGVVSTTLATAEANPYLNPGAAWEDGATVIYLNAGSHAAVGASPATNIATNEWVKVAPHPTNGSKATSIVTIDATTTAYKLKRLQYDGLTVKLGTGNAWLDGIDFGFVRINDCAMDGSARAGTQPSVGIGYRSIACYVDECTGDHGENNWDWVAFSASKTRYCFDGNQFGTRTNGAPMIVREFVGNDGSNMSNISYQSITGAPDAVMAECAFNSIYDISATNPFLVFSENYNTTHGLALVGNIFEAMTSQQLVGVSDDLSDTSTEHVLVWQNTFAGERANLGYNDGTAGSSFQQENWDVVGNCFNEFDNKDDVFNTDTTHSNGSWPVGYGVGFESNHVQIENFKGEFDGLDYSTGSPGFTNDQSQVAAGGGGAGNGDYTPAAGSTLLARLSRRAIEYDINGTQLSSTPDIGAIQVTADAVGSSGGGSQRLGFGLGFGL